MEHVLLYKNPKTYIHNPDLVRLPGGEMLMVIREAPRRRVCTHVDPLSVATLLRSKDNGRTWDTKHPMTAAKGGANVGIQDPSLALLRDGRLFCSFFAWDAPPDAPYGAICTGTFLTESKDGGKTWDANHTTVDLPGGSVYSATTDAILELANGDLLAPNYDAKRHKEGGGDQAIVHRSTDGGKTWKPSGVMGYDPFGNLAFCEPAITQLPSGKLVCMMREEKKKECLWQSDSTDNGHTWSLPRRTGIWGFPADLLSLKSGKLLCTYGYRRRPYGVRAVLSSDEGRTWDYENELIIRKDAPGPDVGYPSSVQLDDGTIFTAYYSSDPAKLAGEAAEKDADDPAAHFADGGQRYIAGSYYREW